MFARCTRHENLNYVKFLLGDPTHTAYNCNREFFLGGQQDKQAFSKARVKEIGHRDGGVLASQASSSS